VLSRAEMLEARAANLGVYARCLSDGGG
jgi:hypothetical protein